ncbi:hypothetical protein [Cryobacterium aureum]|uniref:hypothetical protein n=1 Tax=Cryobacterium aureum TaxID=995037 RepID=UPI00101AEB79|nr:hypothetical protein [Cryobacterium aureum]
MSSWNARVKEYDSRFSSCINIIILIKITIILDRVSDLPRILVSQKLLSPNNARLRQRATGEPLFSANRNSRACWQSGASVLPAASTDQRFLEAQFLCAIDSLKCVPIDHGLLGDSEFVFDLPRVEPHADQLIVQFDRRTELSDLVLSLLPSVDPRDGYVQGIPGLRFRTDKGKVSLHVPGRKAEIILDRVSEKAWLCAVSTAFAGVDPSLLIWSQSPEQVSAAETEQTSGFRTTMPTDDLESILLRRIRALDILKPVAVKAWRPDGRELHVQVRVVEHDLNLADDLITTMTDPRLTPDLRFVGRDRTWLKFESPSGGMIVVRVELGRRSPATALKEISFTPTLPL